MKNEFRILLLLGLFAGPAEGWAAEARISPAFVAPLMAWVEREAGARVSGLPDVIASRERLEKIVFAQTDAPVGRPRSLFTGNTVVLDDVAWEPEDDMQVSLLVHELVHYAQRFMPASGVCRRANEKLAYALQNRWLEMRGHRPFARASWIERVSVCPDAGLTAAMAESPQ